MSHYRRHVRALSWAMSLGRVDQLLPHLTRPSLQDATVQGKSLMAGASSSSVARRIPPENVRLAPGPRVPTQSGILQEIPYLTRPRSQSGQMLQNPRVCNALSQVLGTDPLLLCPAESPPAMDRRPLLSSSLRSSVDRVSCADFSLPHPLENRWPISKGQVSVCPFTPVKNEQTDSLFLEVAHFRRLHHSTGSPAHWSDALAKFKVQLPWQQDTTWHALKVTRGCGNHQSVADSVTPSFSGCYVPVRFFAKRPKKWHGDPWRFAKLEDGVPVPYKQPNEGSTRGRNQRRRHEKRQKFKQMQHNTRKAQTAAARQADAEKRFLRQKENFLRILIKRRAAARAAAGKQRAEADAL